MSTILKALDRLEREKQAEQAARSLREEISTQAPADEPTFSRVRGMPQGVWFVAALLAVAGVTWFLASAPSVPEPAVRPAGVAPSELPKAVLSRVPVRGEPVALSRPPRAGHALPTASEVAPKPILPPTAKAVAPAAPVSETATSPDSQPAVTASPKPRVAAAPKPQGSSAPVVRASSASGSASSPPASPPHADANQEGATSPEEVARAAPSRVLPAAPAPVSEAEPASTAMMRVSRTVWHPSLERRLAFVSLGDSSRSLRVREGDAVGTFVVQRIEPSGVVFIRDGVEVRRGVGEP